MLWDEVDPGDPLSPEQKKALVDWVHWGGQLIISGPDSLDLLKGSFLEPYLPATNGGTRKIAADDPAIAELNEHWLISTPKTPGEPLKPERAVVGDQTQTERRLGRQAVAEHRRAVRRTPGRPRAHRRFRDAAFGTRSHQLAIGLRKPVQRLRPAPAAAQVSAWLLRRRDARYGPTRT